MREAFSHDGRNALLLLRLLPPGLSLRCRRCAAGAGAGAAPFGFPLTTFWGRDDRRIKESMVQV